MKCKKTQYTGHAVKRMFERRLTEEDVAEVISSGEIIKEYPDDKPYPSQILLGTINNEPIHVVVAFDKNSESCYVITVYKPDEVIWDIHFRKKVKK